MSGIYDQEYLKTLKYHKINHGNNYMKGQPLNDLSFIEFKSVFISLFFGLLFTLFIFISENILKYILVKLGTRRGNRVGIGV